MEKVNTLVVDKTGTLTEGKPKLTSIRPVKGISEDELLHYVASLERGSEHPLASAIVQSAESHGIKLTDVNEFASITGKGVSGEIQGHSVAIGNRAMMEEIGVDVSSLDDSAEELRKQAATVIFAAVDHSPGGILE